VDLGEAARELGQVLEQQEDKRQTVLLSFDLGLSGADAALGAAENVVIGEDIEGFASLCQCVLKHAALVDIKLTIIRLQANRLGDSGMACLARTLSLLPSAAWRSSLTELHLSHNQLSDEGVWPLFQAVAAQKARAGCAGVVAGTADPPTKCMWLRIECNRLDPEVVRVELISSL
jgi:hypothetical protein